MWDFFAGVSVGLIIDQPPFVLNEDGEQTVNLKCEQDDAQYQNMYWYRQIRSGRMELVAYSVGKDISTTEAPFNKSKYSMSRPSALSTTLQIYPAKAADSAVYYCASSIAQRFRKHQELYKNLRRFFFFFYMESKYERKKKHSHVFLSYCCSTTKQIR